jgi:hypothetical protein
MLSMTWPATTWSRFSGRAETFTAGDTARMGNAGDAVLGNVSDDVVDLGKDQMSCASHSTHGPEAGLPCCDVPKPDSPDDLLRSAKISLGKSAVCPLACGKPWTASEIALRSLHP